MRYHTDVSYDDDAGFGLSKDICDPTVAYTDRAVMV